MSDGDSRNPGPSTVDPEMPADSTEPHLAGMRVEVVETRGVSSPDDLRKHLGQYQTRFTLRCLGALLGPDWTSGRLRTLRGRPIPLHGIPYVALLAIEAGSDDNPRLIDDDGLAEAFRIFFDLKEPHQEQDDQDGDVALSMVMRMGGQSNAQREIRYQLPRIVTLFRELWDEAAPPGSPSPTVELEKLVGISFEQILFFGWAFAGRGAAQGYFGAYTGLDQAPPLFSPEAQRRFLEWVSSDYTSIRREADRYRTMVKPAFEQYAFNPLVLTPIIRPDVQPEDANGLVYLAPCPRLLFDLVHRGLFSVLAEAGRGRTKGENPFRHAFGSVFQAYVGRLLQASLPSALVYPETKFKNERGDMVDTVDWIVVEGDRAVLIEVKTGALKVPTAALGDLASAREELKKNVGRGVKQLLETERAIRARLLGVEHFAHVQSFERVVVTYESLHFANSFVRDLAVEGFPEPKPHVHVSAIEEFEYVLSPCAAIPLSRLLAAKASDPSTDSMDFKNWVARHRALFGEPNAYLQERTSRILESWGLPAGTIFGGTGVDT